MIIPNIWENKNDVPNHQPDQICVYVICGHWPLHLIMKQFQSAKLARKASKVGFQVHRVPYLALCERHIYIIYDNKCSMDFFKQQTQLRRGTTLYIVVPQRQKVRPAWHSSLSSTPSPLACKFKIEACCVEKTLSWGLIWKKTQNIYHSCV